MKKVLILLLLTLLVVPASYAANNSQFHVGLGMISGSYAGGDEAYDFSVTQGLNFEYEFLKTSKSSNIFKTQIAIHPQTGKMVYFGTFFSKRYYFGSTGIIIKSKSGKNTVNSSPRWRYFAGYDMGLSQVIIREIGAALTVSAALVDLGAHIGSLYQVTTNWAMGVNAGYSYGYGFSTEAVTGTTMKVFLTSAYYF